MTFLVVWLRAVIEDADHDVVAFVADEDLDQGSTCGIADRVIQQVAHDVSQQPLVCLIDCGIAGPQEADPKLRIALELVLDGSDDQPPDGDRFTGRGQVPSLGTK